jgi:hypothetical protein
MVNAAERNQLGAMPSGLGNAAANPLLHHAWRSSEARRHNGGSDFLPGPPIENVGQHAAVDGASA